MARSMLSCHWELARPVHAACPKRGCLGFWFAPRQDLEVPVSQFRREKQSS